VAEVIPFWYVAGVDAVLLAVIAWNAVELGFFESREP
jgi:hypothetical protein